MLFWLQVPANRQEMNRVANKGSASVRVCTVFGGKPNDNNYQFILSIMSLHAAPILGFGASAQEQVS